MAPTGRAYCTDWVVTNSCNCYVANHRDWFTTFTPFPSNFFDAYGVSSEGQKVEGIGDVILPVERGSDPKDLCSQGTLLLRDVLYVPSSACNIFGCSANFDKNFIVDRFGPKETKLLDPASQITLSIIDRPYLHRLRLRGLTPDQTSLETDTHHMINGTWPKSE